LENLSEKNDFKFLIPFQENNEEEDKKEDE
jgi:hypothetical protein